MGAPQRAPFVADDAVPLPIDAVYEPGAHGDVLVQGASGDPYFLGFVAGKHYPPADELIDPALLTSVRASYADGRPEQRTYAFVMFAKRISAERRAALEAEGCRVLGFYPHHTLRVALEPAAIARVAALDFVRWIGLPRPWQKLHPELVARADSAQPGELLDVYIDLHESDLCPQSSFTLLGTSGAGENGVNDPVKGPDDVGVRIWQSNGWQQRALEARGVRIVEYTDGIRAFRARIAPTALEELAGLDFVAAVESNLPMSFAHDESTPMIQSDYTRADYDGGTNAAAIAGLIDSGTDFQHTMLDHTKFRWVDLTPDNDGTLDTDGHGSHVSGTIWGLPDSPERGHTGNAPGLGWGLTGRVRSTKFAEGTLNFSIDNFLSTMRSSYTDSSGNVSPRPHVVNCSWGFAGSFSGTEADARAVDDEVWDDDQLYVFAAGNEGPGGSTIGLPAVAKNAFTVGSVLDRSDGGVALPGTMANNSSRGPCGDGRWKPNVTAPGHKITSANAETSSQYVSYSGTSMAAPHVTGVAAQLVDKYSWMRYAPHRVASVLMASALTDGAAVLTSPSSSAAHLNSFGAGRINAHKAIYESTLDWEWFNWSATMVGGVAEFDDFFVSSSVERVVVCMTYHEPQCDPVAIRALVNNIDLRIEDANGGNWLAQNSSINNTEIRILDNPADGWWRWYALPTLMPTSGTARVSVTVGLIYGDVTPDGSLTVTANDIYVKPNEQVTITADVYNPEYYASSVFLGVPYVNGMLHSASTTLDDGIVTSLVDTYGGSFDEGDLTIGTLRAVDHKIATWVLSWPGEGPKDWTVNARSDNWVDKTAGVTVYVDGTAPGLVTNLGSSTHTAGVWTNDTTITHTWTPATDNLSGIDGYGVFTATVVSPNPATIKDIEEVTSYSETLPDGTRYFSIRSLDNSGNWDTEYATAGPYRIDTVPPTAPAGLSSPTHSLGVQSCSTAVTVDWTPAADAASGLAGYVGIWTTSATTDPTGNPNVAAGATSLTWLLSSSTSGRYLHLRAKDNAGNYGATAHFGPVYANAASVFSYCTGKTNSLGCVPSIGSVGQPDKSAGTFRVTCSNVINQKQGHVFWGFTPASMPFQGGFKCVAAPTFRTPTQSSGGSATGSDCSGSFSFTFTTTHMITSGIDSGETVYCQWWMRDPASPSATGLSNALSFTVCE
jgi:hypothetical protein